MGLAVQGGHLLTGIGPADVDVLTLHAGEVKGVHGLSVLQHDVVGDVHNIVDGTDAGSTQPLPHPLGGGADLDVAHQSAAVPGAEIAVQNVHIGVVQDGVAAALHLGGGDVQLLAEGDGGLTGKADDAQTVGAVGGDLKLHHMVVQTQNRGDVVAWLCALFVEDEDAVLNAVGELLLLGVNVRERQHSAGGGVVADQISLVNVLTVGGGLHFTVSCVQLQREEGIAYCPAIQHFGSNHLAVDLEAGLHILGNGGLLAGEGMIIVEQSGGLDDAVGEVTGVQSQFGQTAEHAVG